MAYLLCRRYRHCEYYWTIALLVTLVFLYTSLYKVHTGAKEGQPEDVVWSRVEWQSRRESEHNMLQPHIKARMATVIMTPLTVGT